MSLSPHSNSVFNYFCLIFSVIAVTVQIRSPYLWTSKNINLTSSSSSLAHFDKRLGELNLCHIFMPQGKWHR